MKFNETLRLERETRGFSLERLSQELDIPVYILEKLENDEDFSTKDSYGRLYAKKVAKFLNIDIPQENKDENMIPKNPGIDTKVLNVFVKLFPHTVAGLVLLLFIYANANLFNKTTNIQINQIKQSYSNPSDFQNQRETQNPIDHITLISEGDVWITMNVDGEKTIINLKEGESKTVYFTNKVTFETIGNADKLKIVFDEQEVKISGREIIHNVFVDSEGVFYNGYNVLRGVPKI
ncbi:helix-turn-helix domain-containing protein [Sulfurihydrogenibium sp.]|uniref:helix-turn-helix domain-containing protein n=1 Tax=Sulfurihydrogenibium sp. TaxID=2053621 RepID=UPI002627E788|nr:helix-turn-helix domain-containing protein [Sulfurihydrogenibium sp.]